MYGMLYIYAVIVGIFVAFVALITAILKGVFVARKSKKEKLTDSTIPMVPLI